jgi:hypothetical protein
MPRLPEEVHDDYLERGLGGTCFSLTYYLLCLLRHAGIDAYACMAHAGRRTNVHCVTMAGTDPGKGRWLLDPGYVISAPLPVRTDRPVTIRTPHTDVRLDYRPDRCVYTVSTGDGSSMKVRYRFRDVPAGDEEFFAHWRRSFSALNGVCLTVRRGDRLIYIHGNYLREIGAAGFRRRRIRGDLHGVIHRVSGVGEDLVAEALAALDRRARTTTDSGSKRQEEAGL